MQSMVRYCGFPACVAATSYLYTKYHKKLGEAVPPLKHISPFTPAGEGALLTGSIAGVSNLLSSHRGAKVATTLVGISVTAFGLKKMQEKKQLEYAMRRAENDRE